MAFFSTRSFRRRGTSLLVLLLLAFFALPSSAINFELHASHYPTPKCIYNTAHKSALIVVTANVGAGPNQRVDIEILDRGGHGNVYLSKRGIGGETRLAVSAHDDGDFGVCFRNYLDNSISGGDAHKFKRSVDLDIDIGADAIDYNAIANQDNLSGLEVEMRKLEGIVKEIVDEIGYLKKREIKFQSTNQSTNDRVQNFSLFTLFALLCLGVWQIFHLRSFFRRKYLID